MSDFVIRALYTISLFIWLCPAVMAEEKTGIQSGEIPDITILADRALTIPLTRLASQYSRDHHASVTVTFAPSFEQMLAIEEGEPADIFISAQPNALKRLKQSGLFDVYSITSLFKSRFALISSEEETEPKQEISVEMLKDFKKQGNFLLAVANKAATAEGYYSAQMIDTLRSDIFLSSNLVQMQNTQDIIDFAKETPAYGIVFETDAKYQTAFTTVGTIPETWHEEATFTGVAIAGGTMKTARDFLQYLKEDTGQKLFTDYGFYSLKDAEEANSDKK